MGPLRKVSDADSRCLYGRKLAGLKAVDAKLGDIPAGGWFRMDILACKDRKQEMVSQHRVCAADIFLSADLGLRFQGPML